MDNGHTILIVDDERVNLEFFDVMLSRLGFAVLTCPDGDEAVDLILSERPDLVLLDNVLPGKTGWEITRLIKQDPEYADVADTSIVMFSAMDDVEDKVEGFDLGIEDYITKPFNFSEVLARIQAVLRHRELSRQVVQRERRLSLMKSLADSFAMFAAELDEPLQWVLSTVGTVDANDPDAVKVFLEQLEHEAKASVERLQANRSAIEELQQKESALQESEMSVDELERRFRRQIRELTQETSDSSGR